MTQLHVLSRQKQYQYMCDLKRTLDATVRELHYKSAVVPLY